jgi:hypothetical protein
MTHPSRFQQFRTGFSRVWPSFSISWEDLGEHLAVTCLLIIGVGGLVLAGVLATILFFLVTQ